MGNTIIKQHQDTNQNTLPKSISGGHNEDGGVMTKVNPYPYANPPSSSTSVVPNNTNPIDLPCPIAASFSMFIQTPVSTTYKNDGYIPHLDI